MKDELEIMTNDQRRQSLLRSGQIADFRFYSSFRLPPSSLSCGFV